MITAYLPYILLITGSLRGVFILGLNLPNTPSVFFTFTIINIILILSFSNFPNFLKHPGSLKNYIHIFLLSVIFGTIWFLGELMIQGINLSSIRAYLIYFIVPLSVFLFIRAKEETLIKVIYFIGVVVAFSCIIDFVVCNIIPGPPIGYDFKRPILDMLVPFGSPRNPSHIGFIYRAHGITGHYHDSGHILTMISVFCVGKLFYEKRNISMFFITAIILIGLFSTLSTANIIAAIVGIIIVSLFTTRFLIKKLIYLTIFSLGIFFLFQGELDLFAKVAPDLDLSGGKMEQMMTLGSSSNLNRFISIILGHEHLSGISDLGRETEVALLNMITRLGVITFIPLMSLLCYPIYIFLVSNNKIKREMWVPIVTLSTGLLTLWHYGSLFRSTSIFLFFAFYSLVLKIYSKTKVQSNKAYLQISTLE